MIFKRPPKSGSSYLRSSFERLALLLGIRWFHVDAFGNYILSNFSKANEVDAFHYLVVRHPIERLLSGWEDKFHRVCHEHCHTTRVSN